MCRDFCLLAFCLAAPGKWKNFTGSPFGFLFHDSGYRESFLQVPKAYILVVTIPSEHCLSNSCGWLECPNFSGLFTSRVMWHYTWNLTPKRWISWLHSLNDFHFIFHGVTMNTLVVSNDVWKRCLLSLPVSKRWRSRYKSVNYGISNYWST